MDTRTPAEVFPPGDYLADELEAREWSQADFAAIVGRPVQWVSELVNGKKEVTAESASQIASALGTSAEMWMSLQAKYRLWELSQDKAHVSGASRVAQRARLSSIIPLTTLEKRGLIDASGGLAGLLEEVMGDFNMSSPDDPPFFEMAAKRANVGEDLNLQQRGWLWLARREARKSNLPPYQPTALRLVAEGLSHQVSEPSDLRHLPDEFAEVGVHLVHVEHLPGGKIDGAAFMLDENPVVAVSGRGKRFDKVFFSLMHEIAHVLSGHIEDALTIDDESEPSRESDPREEAANLLAEQLTFGERVLVDSPRTAAKVEAKAAALGVPLAFVVGNLQHHRDLDWRTTLARGLPNVDSVLQAWSRS